MTRRRLILIGLLLVVTAVVSAQSLLDDPQYRALIDEVQELKAQAQVALDEGRYDDAVALSQEAEAVADEAENYAEERVLRFRANSWVNRAQQRIQYAESINAQTHYPDEWELSNRHMADARASFEAEQWVEAIAASRLAFNALESVRPVRVSSEEPEPKPVPQPARSRCRSRNPSPSPNLRWSPSRSCRDTTWCASFPNDAIVSGGLPSTTSSTVTPGSGESSTKQTAPSSRTQTTPTSCSRAW